MNQLREIGGQPATRIDQRLRATLVLPSVGMGLPTGGTQPLLHRYRRELQQFPRGDATFVTDAAVHFLATQHGLELAGFQARAAAGDRDAVWSYVQLPGRRVAADPARFLVPWATKEIMTRVIAGDQEAVKRLGKLAQTLPPDNWKLQRQAMVWQGERWYENGTSFSKNLWNRTKVDKHDCADETLKSHYAAAVRFFTPQFASWAWLFVHGAASAPAVPRTSVLRFPT
jgi:hypothetical protein